MMTELITLPLAHASMVIRWEGESGVEWGWPWSGEGIEIWGSCIDTLSYASPKAIGMQSTPTFLQIKFHRSVGVADACLSMQMIPNETRSALEL